MGGKLQGPSNPLATVPELCRVAAMINKTLSATLIFSFCVALLAPAQEEKPFGDKFPNLDGMATGKWWEKAKPAPEKPKKGRKPKQIVNMDVPRDEVVAFAVYTHDGGTLKLSAQLFPPSWV